MTKTELIEKVSSDTKLSKTDTGMVLNSVIDNISKALKKGDNVTLIGFGTFDVTKRKARKGKNPQTGETIKIPAKKAPRFRAGKGLKDLVGGKKKK